jgi:short-subunit dehydrogenase
MFEVFISPERKILRINLLENKWAFVTGTSRSIGQQIAIGFAQRKCNVIVHART